MLAEMIRLPVETVQIQLLVQMAMMLLKAVRVRTVSRVMMERTRFLVPPVQTNYLAVRGLTLSMAVQMRTRYTAEPMAIPSRVVQVMIRLPVEMGTM